MCGWPTNWDQGCWLYFLAQVVGSAVTVAVIVAIVWALG